MAHFGNWISVFYVPKALFCVNIKLVLQVVFQLQGWIAREALYAFLLRLKLHEFNYTVITYDTLVCRDETKNAVIYKFPRKY